MIPLFYEEKENLWQIKESMLEKIEEIKFQKIKLYVKNALIETLNFLYGIEKDFLEKNKFNVIFYLIYLSFAFYNEQKNISSSNYCCTFM